MCIGSCLCLCTGLCSRLCTGVPAHLVGLVTVHVLVQMSVNAPALPTAHTRALTSVPRAVSAQGVVLTSVHALVPAQRLCSQACSRGAARVQTQPPASPCSQPPPPHHMDPPRLVRQPCTPPPSRALVRALVRRHHLLGGSSAGPFLGGGGCQRCPGGGACARRGPGWAMQHEGRELTSGGGGVSLVRRRPVGRDVFWGGGGSCLGVPPPRATHERCERRPLARSSCHPRARLPRPPPHGVARGKPAGGGGPRSLGEPSPRQLSCEGGCHHPLHSKGAAPQVYPTHGPPE